MPKPAHRWPLSTDLEQLAERVDQAIAEVQSLEPEVRAKAMTLKSAIEEFHKVGLTHIVKTLKNDPDGKKLLLNLVDEPTVYALFAMHGLVRADLKTQVSRVIEMVRPYMQSHGGDVSTRRCARQNGVCPAVGQLQWLFDVLGDTSQYGRGIACRTCARDRKGRSRSQRAGSRCGLVQLQAGLRRTKITVGWRVRWYPKSSEDKPFAFENGEDKILLIKSRRRGLRAYRNACAHQGLPLDGGILDEENGTITCPWHGFQFDSESGECFSAPQCQLEPFPLRVSEDRVWVRPG